MSRRLPLLPDCSDGPRAESHGGRNRRSGAYVAAENSLDPTSSRLNVVMMGMGEPLLNLPQVLKATELLTDNEVLASRKSASRSPRRVSFLKSKSLAARQCAPNLPFRLTLPPKISAAS